MIVDSIISSVTGYFTSLSVSSKWGYPKVTLIEADENKEPTGLSVSLDATEGVSVSISKTLMQHNSENMKVYLDGTRKNPTTMSISATIETTSLMDLQELAKSDTWLWVSHSKDMGGVYHNTEGGNPLTLSGAAKIISDQRGAVDGVVDDAKSLLGLPTEATDYALLYSDCTLYTVRNLSIDDSGFMNTVDVTIELVEVVLFEVDIEKTNSSSVKKAKPSTKKQKTKKGPEVEKAAPPIDTRVKLNT